jgi:ABC-2 type transport system ATP-binding protein
MTSALGRLRRRSEFEKAQTGGDCGQGAEGGKTSSDKWEVPSVGLMSELLVEVRDLGKLYVPSPPFLRALLRSSLKAPVEALSNMSLTVYRGEVRAVIGPNGAGKSTLFRILTGLTTPTTGTARVLGMDCTHQSAEVRRVVGFAPAEERTLLLRHTSAENLMFHGQLHGIPSKQLRPRISETLELVGLEYAADRVVFGMSTGMRARLLLARAMLHQPEVLILDEPTGLIDPVSAYEFLEMVKRVVEERQIGALVSSHRLEEIEALHDKVLVLNRGRILYDGNLDDLRMRWERPTLTIRLWDSNSSSRVVEKLQRLEGAEIASVDGDVIVIETSLGAGDLLSQLDSDLASVASVGQTRISLLDLLVRILGSDADGQQTE